MASVVGSAEVVVGPSFKGFQKSVASKMVTSGKLASNSFAGATEKAGIGSRMASSIGNGLKTGLKVTGVALTGILGTALVKGFQRLNSIEQAQAKLKGLGNSAKDVTAIMDNALAAVKGTAFGLDEAATVAANAVAAGVKPGQDLEKTLKLVADAATIGGTSMGEMGSIFNKVATSGKVQADVMNQLNDRGIPIVQLLGKSMGKTSAQIQELSKQGKIDFADFQKAMELGMGGAALKSGNTVQGAFKNMGAALSRFGAAFLEKLFPHLQKSFVNITTFLDNMTTAVKPLAAAIGGFLGPAFEKLTGALAKFDPKKVTDFFKNLKGGGDIKTASSGMQSFGGMIKKVGGTIKEWFSGIDFKGILGGLGNAAKTATPTIKNFLAALPSIASGIGKGFIDFWGALTPALKSIGPIASQLGSTLGQVLGTALTFISNHIDTVVKFLPAIITGFLAWKAATQVTAAAQVTLQAAQLKALPLTTANNALRVVANFLENQSAAATLKNVAAKKAENVAEVTSNTVKKKSLVTMAAMKAAQLAQAVASKAVAAAQWVLNAAMAANPIGLVVIAIAALVAGFIIAYKKSETFRKIVNGVFLGFKITALTVLGWFRKNLVPFFTTTLPNAFKAVVDWVKKNWKGILGWIVNPVGSAVKLIIKHKDQILGVFKGLKSWAGGVFKKGWSTVTSVLTAPVKAGYTAVKTHLSNAKDRFNGLKTDISGKWKKGWAGAKSWMGDAVSKGKESIKTSLTTTKDNFNTLKKSIGTKWKDGWKSAKGWIADPVGKGKDLIRTHRDTIKAVFNNLDTFGRSVFGPKWDKMKDKLKGPIADAKAYFKDVFGKGGGGIPQLLTDFISNAKTILARIANVVLAPIRKMITNINNGLIGTKKTTGLNYILGKLGAATIHWIPDPHFADGGIFMKHRYTPGKDIGTAQLSGYESIMRPEFTRAAGEPWVNAANAAAKRGGVGGAKRFLMSQSYGAYANGGVVRPTNSGKQNASYAGHSGIDFYGGVGDPIYAVTDGRITYEGSGRGYGNAIFMVSDKGMPMVYGHTSAYVAKQGQNVRKGQLIGRVGYSGNVRPPGPGGAHLHYEIGPNGFASPGNRALTQNYLSGGGLVDKVVGAVSGVLDFLKGASPVSWMIDKAKGVASKIMNLGSGSWVAGLAKAPGMIINAGKDWIQKHISDSMASDAQWSGASVGSLGRDQLNVAATIIKTAKALGFGQRGAIIGLMTAMQESTMRELSGGDRDSVGPFQQRAPWGSFNKRKNAASSAQMFFNGGDGGQPGLRSKAWKTMGLGQAAQAVQVSAYPDAYNKWEGLARQLVSRGYSGGTMNARPGLALVGERRPEIVNFRGGEQVWNEKMLRSASGGMPSKLGVNGRLQVDSDGLTAYISGVATADANARGKAAVRRNNLTGVN